MTALTPLDPDANVIARLPTEGKEPVLYPSTGLFPSVSLFPSDGTTPTLSPLSANSGTLSPA